jgi:hypothetical protein
MTEFRKGVCLVEKEYIVHHCYSCLEMGRKKEENTRGVQHFYRAKNEPKKCSRCRVKRVAETSEELEKYQTCIRCRNKRKVKKSSVDLYVYHNLHCISYIIVTNGAQESP